MLPVQELENTMVLYGKKIGLENQSPLYPVVTTPDKIYTDGTFLYVDGEEYYYTSKERGTVIKQYHSKSVNDILYYAFQSITFEIAARYAAKNRNENEDFRRVYFERQLELLKEIAPTYRKKREKEIEEILKRHPFDDAGPKRD